jgi:hypothetical protein
MAVEAKRGCGYRKAGGLYLVGDLSDAVPVDYLPACVDYAQTRAAEWASPARLLASVPPGEAEGFRRRERALLMWVGETHYSPASFLAEARRMGVSKRIAAIPSDAQPGDPIALAHPAAMTVTAETAEPWPQTVHCGRCLDVPVATALTNGLRNAAGKQLVQRKDGTAAPRALPTHDPLHVAGVFCLFTLQAVELVLPRSVASDPEIVRRCAARGVRIVSVPDDDPDHVPAGWKLPSWLRDDEPLLPGLTEGQAPAAGEEE